jgi:hypothetical protein
MGSGIFISYRRADSRHAAGRLADELAAAFGEANIFRDIEGIDIGVNFAVSLERALGACVVMLVLIGPHWLDARDDAGQRRLDQPDDWTRQEVATALKRGIPVVPVLLEDTPLPRPDQLPADLQELASRQQFSLADARWRGDVKALIDKLARVKGLKRLEDDPRPAPLPQPGPRRKVHWGWWLAGGAVVVLAALWSEFEGAVEGDTGIMFDPATASPPAARLPPVNPATNAQAQPPVEEDGATTLPNLAGLWRTASGETYHFQQEGNQLRFTAEANGQNIGNGRGELQGSLLRIQMTMQLNGMLLGNLVCDMQAAPDMRSFTGSCLGPRGQFPAQFFR